MISMTKKLIISTRPQLEDDTLTQSLSGLGAMVIHAPLIQILPVERSAILDDVFHQLGTYAHIIFTSRNGVKYFYDYAHRSGIPLEFNSNVQFSAVGRRTADEFRKHCSLDLLVGSGTTSEDLLKQLLDTIVSPQRILLPVGNLAGAVLEEGLSPSNHITRLEIYRTQPVSNVQPEVMERIRQNAYDLIIFTSPSAVDALYSTKGIGENFVQLRAACIGSTTRGRAVELGIEPVLTASEPDGAVFAAEITEYLRTHKTQ